MVIWRWNCVQNSPPPSQVAPSTILISSHGFAKHAPDGTGDTAIDIAIRKTREELDIEITADQLIQIHDTTGIDKRLLRYPELTLEGNYKIEGVHPSICMQYLVQSPLSSKELIDRVRLNWESDGMVLVPIEEGIKLWSNVRDEAKAILYPSSRIQLDTLNRNDNSLANIFANAKQVESPHDEKHKLAPNMVTPFHLIRDNSVINGSQNPYEILLRVARMALNLG
jgi:hypothetical protein